MINKYNLKKLLLLGMIYASLTQLNYLLCSNDSMSDSEIYETAYSSGSNNWNDNRVKTSYKEESNNFTPWKSKMLLGGIFIIVINLLGLDIYCLYNVQKSKNNKLLETEEHEEEENTGINYIAND
jgi:hypothetical protein